MHSITASTGLPQIISSHTRHNEPGLCFTLPVHRVEDSLQQQSGSEQLKDWLSAACRT